jgi:intein-encoded DNA endonuclease-like protein
MEMRLMRYKSYTHEKYLRAMDLLKKGYGLTETCRILGWPEDKIATLHYWKNGRHKPPAARWIPEPSSELAYIIGVLKGDGYLYKHKYHYDIKLDTRDYEFAETFGKALAKVLNKKVKKPYWDKSDNIWKIYYRSKAFYMWYRKQNLKSLKRFIEHGKETVALFLRGLYDSDGGHYRYRERYSKIYLYNNDLELLHYVQHLLNKYFNITARGPYLHIRAGEASTKKNGERIRTNYNNYSIKISRKQHVETFLNEIGFSIAEKQLGLPRRRR